jgi:small subunit ribosomal protein S15
MRATEGDEVSFRQGGRLPGLQNKRERYTAMKLDKAAIKNEFQRHDRDTGSSEVQIAILTRQIQALTEHLKANKKDHSSRYGLLRKVANRRNLLDYLKRENEESYKALIAKLGLRR